MSSIGFQLTLESQSYFCKLLIIVVSKSCVLKCMVDSCVVYRKETVGFEEVQQFIKEVVRILLNKELEIMNVMWSRSQMPQWLLLSGRTSLVSLQSLRMQYHMHKEMMLQHSRMSERSSSCHLYSQMAAILTLQEIVQGIQEYVQGETRKSTKSNFPYLPIFCGNCKQL